MGDANLFEFAGPDLVAGVDLRRAQGRVRVTVAFTTDEGLRRLCFDGPEPLEAVFPIVGAEQVWVYMVLPATGEGLRMKVEYFSGEYHEFTVDAVLDLDPPSYDTHPDIPVTTLGTE